MSTAFFCFAIHFHLPMLSHKMQMLRRFAKHNSTQVNEVNHVEQNLSI
uniref:Uncharacterized protein n=1 Tax=Anguilla anguilla TaxID=7936 RepID=A0A0E9T5P7_ANGAN